jgi:hypothetical protein
MKSTVLHVLCVLGGWGQHTVDVLAGGFEWKVFREDHHIG